MNFPDFFPLARYRFEFEVTASIRLPEYAGSALRGVFGAALRGVVCMTGMKTCPGCGLLRTCPYPQIFESPPPLIKEGEKPMAVYPNPYVIEPPPRGTREYLPGARLVFHLVLAGRALIQLPLLIFAWQRAFERGIGPGNGTATLHRVLLIEETGEIEIFTPVEGKICDHETVVTVPSWKDRQEIPLRILTPMRIQKEGSPVGPERLTPRDLLVTLLRRVSQVAEIHMSQSLKANYQELAQQAMIIGVHGRLTWRDWTRHSRRQQQEMTLGGVVGNWVLTGHLEPFWPFLYLGQWLHVGKNSTFGLGQYRIIEEIHS
ncbi:CRISPR-associated protein Cas6 [Gammaproteobacteria bacterium]